MIPSQAQIDVQVAAHDEVTKAFEQLMNVARAYDSLALDPLYRDEPDDLVEIQAEYEFLILMAARDAIEAEDKRAALHEPAVSPEATELSDRLES